MLRICCSGAAGFQSVLLRHPDDRSLPFSHQKVFAVLSAFFFRATSETGLYHGLPFTISHEIYIVFIPASGMASEVIAGGQGKAVVLFLLLFSRVFDSIYRRRLLDSFICMSLPHLPPVNGTNPSKKSGGEWRLARPAYSTPDASQFAPGTSMALGFLSGWAMKRLTG